MNKVIIIAEIGECFNGDLDNAKKLIITAKKYGCDFVKFQTLDYENIADCDLEKRWFEKISLDPKKIAFLIKFAKKVKIKIIFTPVNVKTAGWLLDAGLKDVKIASCSIIDLELIKFINSNFNKVFLSTGMASLKEVNSAVSYLGKIRDLYIMHCISEYPTGPLLEYRGLKALSNEDVRLNMLLILKRLFPEYNVGYSDHTCGILASIVAVALGARAIEKHITLDREKPIKNFRENKTYLGTDHILSLEPKELREMVLQIRETEKMLGQYKWERTAGEKVLKNFLRRRFSRQ